MATAVAAAAAPRTLPAIRYRTPFGFLGAFRRDPLGFFQRGRARHGDAFRVRAPLVDVCVMLRPEHARHVLQDHHRNYWKGPIFQRLTRFAGNGILFSEGDFWLRQRRMAAPAFHRAAVESWGDAMAAAAERVADRWARRPDGEPFEVSREMAELALEIVAEALLGGAELGEWKARFVTNINYGVEYANWLLNTLAPAPIWVPTRRNRTIRRYMAELDGFLLGAIEKRRREGGARSDLLGMLLDARDDATNEGMTDRQLLDECVTFISAGHETTGMALSWLWHALAIHPEVEARLHQEVDAVLGDRIPGVADLPRLAYTRRVIDETLRLYPPAWATSRQAYADDEIDGWAVPRNAGIFLSPWMTHRLPDLWEDPERFDPDRFTPERSEGRPRYAYYPFGGGARLCIGREFALMELQLVVATLARRLRLRAAPDRPPAEPDPIFTLRPKHGVWMTAEPRPQA